MMPESTAHARAIERTVDVNVQSSNCIPDFRSPTETADACKCISPWPPTDSHSTVVLLGWEGYHTLLHDMQRVCYACDVAVLHRHCVNSTTQVDGSPTFSLHRKEPRTLHAMLHQQRDTLYQWHVDVAVLHRHCSGT